MIASFGGAEVSKDGTLNYAGSGGMVGGLSLPLANLSRFTGAGQSYNRFTPSLTPSLIDIESGGGGIDPVDTGGGSGGGGRIDTGGGSGGGVITGTSGGGSPTVIPSVPVGAQTTAPSWIQGVYNSIYNGAPISLQFSPSGSVSASYRGQQYLGYVFQYLNNFYLYLNGDVSSLNPNTGGLETVNLTRGGTVDYTGYTAPATVNCWWGNCNDPNPTVTPAGGTQPDILQRVLGLLGSAPAPTNVSQPPNLFQVAPTGGSSANGVNMKTLAIIAVVALAAWWAYKKYYA